MNLSRRNLSLLLPALAATAVAREKIQKLTTKVYHDDQIPYEGNQQKKSRRFFNGVDHSGFHVETHETILGAGTETHAPHKHEHEEIIILVEGSLEAYLDGKTEAAQAGSVIYFGPNQMHSVRNIGTKPCRYYVVELRGNEA
jgi:quercetin dioxygenase-like cupin family protein